MRKVRVWAWVVGCLLLWAPGAAAQWLPSNNLIFDLVMLPDLGATYNHYRSTARSINNNNQIVGWATPKNAIGVHGVYWLLDANGDWQITDLFPAAGDMRSEAWAVNDIGAIAGYFNDANGEHAFLWAGGMQTLNVSPGDPDAQAWATGVNNNSVVVGAIGDSKIGDYPCFDQACVWPSLDPIFLDQSCDGYSWWCVANAINDNNQVAGFKEDYQSGCNSQVNNGYRYAVFWDGERKETALYQDVAQAVGFPVESGAYAINQAGVVAGYMGDYGAYGAFLWDKTNGFRRSGYGRPQAINKDLYWVGTYDYYGNKTPTIYKGTDPWGEDKYYDLNYYITGDLDSYVKIVYPFGINDNLWIVGAAWDSNNMEYRAFLLKPHVEALFYLENNHGPAPFTAKFYDLSLSAFAWQWDFGDGGTSTDQNPTHIYNQPGTYTLKLTVTGPDGTKNTLELVDYIVVAGPPTIAVDPTSLSATCPAGQSTTQTFDVWNAGGQVLNYTLVPADIWVFVSPATGKSSNSVHVTHTVTYNSLFLSPSATPYTSSIKIVCPDASNSPVTIPVSFTVTEPPPQAAFTTSPNPASGNAPLTVTFTNNSSGNITALLWDFGDGTTSTDLQAWNASHTYNLPDNTTTQKTYNASLTVANSGGQTTAYATVTVNAVPPVAAFTPSTTSGQAPLTVTFTDQSTGTIGSWYWGFGDGETSGDQSPTHTFKTLGTYNVLLTVSGPGGSDQHSATITVTPPPAPKANFTANPTKGTAPLTVQFTDTSTGQYDTWAWDFGDGGTSEYPNPSHTYATAQKYTAKLTVTGLGGSNSKTLKINVAKPGAPKPSFVPAPSGGPAPLFVVFTDTSTGLIDTWEWDFGDPTSGSANTSKEQHPNHTFNSAGKYKVRLTVTGPGGTKSKTGTIKVTLPVAPARLLWMDRFSLGGGDTEAAAAAAAGATAFVAGKGYDPAGKCLWLVKAYDSATGTPKWQDAFDLGGGCNAAQAVVVSGSTAYVAGWAYEAGTGYLVVRAYDTRSSTPKWTFKTPLEQVENYPVGLAAQGNTVVACANGLISGQQCGAVLALDPKTGTSQWVKNLTAGSGANQASALALSGATAVVAGWHKDAGKTWWLVQAFDLKTGAYKWADKCDWGEGHNQADALAARGATITVAGYAAIAGKGNMVVKAYDAQQGALKWTQTFGLGEEGNGATAAALNGACAYVSGYVRVLGQWAGFVSAYDGPSGAPLWPEELDLSDVLTYPQALVAGPSRVYLAGGGQAFDGNDNWLVRAYDTEGDAVWADQFDLGGGGSAAMALTAGRKSIMAAGWGKNAAGSKEWLVRAYAP